MKNAYDVVVIGGGPAGSTVASLVAKAGHSVLLVEREAMPRYHVGESLLPEANGTLERLGLLETMRASHFIKKSGVQFVGACGKEVTALFYREHDHSPRAQSWQVERADFDFLLFRNAAAFGAHCRDQTRVLEVLFDDYHQARGVRLKTEDGQQHEIKARVVVDATGQQTLLAAHFGTKRPNEKLRKAAIWTYYRGAIREPDVDGGATLLYSTKCRQAWFWYVPLSGDTTSIGLVADSEYLFRDRVKPCQVYEEQLVNCPAILHRLVNAHLVGDFHVAREFSYGTSQMSGNGWLTVGDAAGFVDPIFCSGVLLALKSGEWAADAICAALSWNDTSAAQLGAWTRRFQQGRQRVERLVELFYSPGFRLKAYLDAHPRERGPLLDLLMGRYFEAESESAIANLESYFGEAPGAAELAQRSEAR